MRNFTFSSFLLCSLLSFSQNFKYSDIPPDMLKNANAVARLDAIDITVEAVDKMTYSERFAITVLNKEGDKRVRTNAYYDKSKKIKKIEAYI